MPATSLSSWKKTSPALYLTSCLKQFLAAFCNMLCHSEFLISSGMFTFKYCVGGNQRVTADGPDSEGKRQGHGLWDTG